MATTVKNIGLSPINRGTIQEYAAKQNPNFRQEIWDDKLKTNDTDFYLYTLKKAQERGIGPDAFNYEGLDQNPQDEWAEFYRVVMADDQETKDYGEDYGTLTEKEYLGKLLEEKREYNAWVHEEERIAQEKEALSGWEKFWNGTGAFFSNLGLSLEQTALSLVDFFTNWDGDKESADWLQPWVDSLEARKLEQADFERRYTDLRDVETWETTFGGTLVIGGAQTLGLMLPSIVANYFLPGSGMYVMYGGMFVNNVYEARHDKDVAASEVEILLRAALQTGVELAIEKMLGSSLLDDLVLNSTAARAGREFVKVSTSQGIKILLKNMAHEAAEEALQEIGSNAVNMIMAQGNKTWEKYNSDTLILDVSTAALLGGIFSAGHIMLSTGSSQLLSNIRALAGKSKPGDVIVDYRTEKGSKPKTIVEEGTEPLTTDVSADTYHKMSKKQQGDYQKVVIKTKSDQNKSGYTRKTVYRKIASTSETTESEATTKRIYRADYDLLPSEEQANYKPVEVEEEIETDVNYRKGDKFLTQEQYDKLPEKEKEGFKRVVGKTEKVKRTMYETTESSTPIKYKRMNLFERLAMRTNLSTFFEDIKNAKAGKLTTEERKALYAKLVTLGKIFGKTDEGSLARAAKLLEDLNAYAESESPKQDKIIKADEIYLSTLVADLRSIQQDALIKFWGDKVQKKEAAKALKEARVTKGKRIINENNVEEETETLQSENTQDDKPQGRKKAIESLVHEGFEIIGTDGEQTLVLEQEALVPDDYLMNGDPSKIVAEVVEKDTAQEFVDFMRSPKNAIKWAQIKSAMINAFPEMGPRTIRIKAAKWAALPPEEQAKYTPSATGKTYTTTTEGFTDQQIALNILFNRGGAYALVSQMSNAEFNIFFLNMLEGLKKVVRKTNVGKAAQKKAIDRLEENFRFAATKYCLDNLGVDPHNLHNVLTPVDQQYIKIERAKAAAGVEETAARLTDPDSEGRQDYISPNEILDENTTAGKEHRKLIDKAEKEYGAVNPMSESDRYGFLTEDIEFTLESKEKGLFDAYQQADDYLSIFEDMHDNSYAREVIEAIKTRAPFPEDTFTRMYTEFAKEEGEVIEPALLEEPLAEQKEGYDNLVDFLYGFEHPEYVLAMLEYFYTPVFTQDASGRTGSNTLLPVITVMINNTPWLFKDSKAVTLFRGLKVKKGNADASQKFVNEVKKRSVGESFTFNDEGSIMPVSVDVTHSAVFTGEDIDGQKSDGVLVTFIFPKQDGIMLPVGKMEGEILVKGGLTYKVLAKSSDSSEILLLADYTENSRNEIELPVMAMEEPTEEDLTSIDDWTTNPEYNQEESFTTKEYGNRSYTTLHEMKVGKKSFLKRMSALEQSVTTLTDIINNPTDYITKEGLQAIEDEFGDTDPGSVYQYIRNYLLQFSNGYRTLVKGQNNERYYFADVTPVKQWNTTEITDAVDVDPEGRSLIEKYKGKTVPIQEFIQKEALVGTSRNTDVVFVEGGGSWYSKAENKIYIDLKQKIIKNNQQLLFAINHEFQHALQVQDRMAGGFTYSSRLSKALVEYVKEFYPTEFKEGLSPSQEERIAKKIIYANSGEKEANLRAHQDRDFAQWVIASDGNGYAVYSPFEKEVFRASYKKKAEKKPKSALEDDRGNDIKKTRIVSKKANRDTPLRYLFTKGKKARIDPRVQDFMLSMKDSDLDKLDDDLALMITSGDLKSRAYQKMIEWFKDTNYINEYTFNKFHKYFWPDSPITSFKQLMEIALDITMDVDERGNPHEVEFRYGNQKFVVNEDLYRVAVMEHWQDSSSMADIRKLVGATEILRRTIPESKLKKAQNKEGETLDLQIKDQATADFVDATLNNTTRERKIKALRGTVIKNIKRQALEGTITYEEAKKSLEEFNEDYLNSLDNDTLDQLYLKHVMKQQGVSVTDEKLKEALSRNRKNSIANSKRLATTIWKNTTPKTRKRLPEGVIDLFDKNGKLKREAYEGKSQLDIVRLENLLKKIASKARRGVYNSEETLRLEKEVEENKAKMERVKKQKDGTTSEVRITQVVKEYVTDIKTETKIIKVRSSKKAPPAKLKKILATSFNKTRVSNIQEMDNAEYHVAERARFVEENKEILDSLSEAQWMAIVEWFEASEFVGTEMDLALFKAIRMYTLSDLVARIKTNNIVLGKEWLGRINNLLKRNVHSSAVELATWGKVLDSINPFRRVAEEYNVDEETVEELQEALESEDDKALAEAIDKIKQEIAENYVEKSMMEKLISFRYSAMLSGPMTWLRNLLSNYIVKHFNKWAAAIGQKLVGKKLSGYEGYTLVGTKVRNDALPGDEIVSEDGSKVNIVKFIQQNLIDNGLLHQLLEGYSKYDPYSAETSNDVDTDYIIKTMIKNFNKQFEEENLYGQGRAAKMFTKFSSFVRKMISDEKFVSEATLRYFGKMLTEDIENGKLDPRLLAGGMFTKEIVSRFAQAQWLAMNDYMKNANFMTKAMSELNKSPYARYIMPIIIPFAQSSWNWWMETIRYSPLGWIGAIKNLINYDKYVAKMDEKRASTEKAQSASVQGKMFDRYMVTRNVGKAVIGTALWTIGIILAATGVAGISRNKDDKYVLKLGNVEIDIEPWFGSSSVLAGIAAVDVIKTGDWGRMFSVTIDQMVRTLFVTDLLSTFKYETPGDYVANLPGELLISFIPAFIKNLNTNLQVYKVKYDKGLLGMLERFAGSLIPGLTYAFDAEVDPFTGKKMFYRIPILTQFGGISYNDISAAEREAAIHGVYSGSVTGEITVGDSKYQLDAMKVNTYKGEYTGQFVNALINDEVRYKGKRYSQMTDDEKRSAIQSCISKATNYAKIRAWTEEGHKYYAGDDLYIALKSLGIQNVYRGSGGYIKK